MPSIEFIKKTFDEFFRSKPVINTWIFGSYARGEQKQNSDLDILVEFDPDNYPSLLTHSGMICDLENIFNIKIDLVPADLVFDSIKPQIEKDKILIYEKY